jgi:hypothetical protein
VVLIHQALQPHQCLHHHLQLLLLIIACHHHQLTPHLCQSIPHQFQHQLHQ